MPTKLSNQNFFFQDQTKTPPHQFQCTLTSKQCQDHTKQGKGPRCRNHTVIGLDYCRAHLRANWGLDVTPADNPQHGMGLRAVGEPGEIVFRPNDFIAYYNGQKITEQELALRYGDKTGTYAAQFSVRKRNGRPGFKWLEDAACQRGLGALANHKPPSSANATLATFVDNGRYYSALRALKPIRAKSEIFVSYGDLKAKGAYKLHEDGVRYQTIKRKKPKFV